METGDFHLNKLPQSWSEGMFVGNGLIGAMVWKEDRDIRIEMGNAAVAHRRPGKEIEDLARIPIGSFRTPAGSGGKMSLVLIDAEITVDLDKDRQFSIRAQSDSDVIVIQGSFKHLKWQPAESIVATDKSKNTANPPGWMEFKDQTSIFIQPLLGGGGVVTAWIHDVEKQRFLITTQINYQKIGSAVSASKEILRREIGRAPETSLSAHKKWWTGFLNSFRLDLPDADLNKFCLRQHYKLGSALRSHGPALDLFGPWYTASRWTHYFWNLNIQMNYAPVGPSGHADLAESLARMLTDNMDALRQNVPELEQDPQRMQISGTTGNDCRGRLNDEMGNLLWACHSIWLWYAYTDKEEILTDYLLPILVPTTNHHISRSSRNSKGQLQTGIASSPEYGDGTRALGKNTNYELALLRWACQTLLDTHEALNLTHPDKTVWRQTLDDLIKSPEDENGLMIAEGVPFECSHRHWSHLLGIYPLYNLDPDKPNDRKLIERSLDHWMSLDEHLAGYSFAAAAAMQASLGYGDRALIQLKTLLNESIQPNTMYLELSHPHDRANPDPEKRDRTSPTMETPLLLWRAVMDMLICDRNGRVHILPALPSTWIHLSIQGFAIYGGSKVDMEVSEGRLRRLKIHAPSKTQSIILVCKLTDFKKMAIRGTQVIHIDQTQLEVQIPANGQAIFEKA